MAERPDEPAPETHRAAAPETHHAAETSPADDQPQEEPPSGEEAIRGVKDRGAEWLESAIARQAVDEILDRFGALGKVSVADRIYQTHIHQADIAGGLRIGGTGEPQDPEPLLEVAPDDPALNPAMFVVPDGFAAIEDAAAHCRIVVVQAPGGSGRRSAALRLAAALGADRIRYLRRDRIIGTLAGDSTDRRRFGYVVLDLDLATARRLDQFDLAALDRWLADSLSHLIITVDTAVRLPTALLRYEGLIRTTVSMPSAELVADTHGRAVLPADRHPELIEALRRPAITDFLRAHPEPGTASRVGTELAAAILGGSVAETVERLVDDRDERVESWFTAHPEPWQQAFAIAAAALSGSTYLAVTDAAGDLLDLLVPEKHRPVPAAHRFRELIDDRHFRVVTAMAETPFGAFPVEAVEVCDDLVRMALLRHLWRELDGPRRAVADWLSALGGHPNPAVRVNTAATIGLLAIDDFPYAFDRFLRPWSTHRAPAARQSAALALSLPGSDARFADQVRNLLADWAGGAHSTAVTETAIAAYGGPLGALRPEAAMKGLREAACAGWRHFASIAQSVFLLLEAGHAEPVLTALLAWTEPGRRGGNAELAAIGLGVFLACADILGEDPPLLRTGEQHLEMVAELWGRAIGRDAVARNYGLDLLRTWCRYADDHLEARSYVLDLLMLMARQSDLQLKRLHHHLYRWAADPESPSRTAQTALSALPVAQEAVAP